MYDDFKRDFEPETSHLDYGDIQRIVGQKLLGSIGWMITGLLLTGLVGFLVVMNESVFMFVYTFYYGLIIAELVLVFIFSAMLMRSSAGTLRLIFLAYAALNGLTLGGIGYMYTGASILYVFLGTVVYYASLAAYGYFTKENLGKYMPYLFGTLIALVIVSIINLFLKNDITYWICTYIGVIVFSLFTAVDMNLIKRRLTEYALEDESMLNKIQICGALNLYLDFINLFLYLLRIFGKRR